MKNVDMMGFSAKKSIYIYIYNLFRKIKEANDAFNERYILQNLIPVFEEVKEAHTVEVPVIYSFSAEAQAYFDGVEEKVKLGLRQSSSAVVFDSDDEEEDADESEAIRSIIGIKYMDQLGRLALSLHVFASVLEQILGRNAGRINIPSLIPRSTVQNARALLDHILNQNEMVLNVSKLLLDLTLFVESSYCCMIAMPQAKYFSYLNTLEVLCYLRLQSRCSYRYLWRSLISVCLVVIL